MKELIAPILIVIGTIAVVAVLLALPTLLLWNWLMTTIFELPYVNFWQALGIQMFAGILFRQSQLKKSDK